MTVVSPRRQQNNGLGWDLLKKPQSQLILFVSVLIFGHQWLRSTDVSTTEAFFWEEDIDPSSLKTTISEPMLPTKSKGTTSHVRSQKTIKEDITAKTSSGQDVKGLTATTASNNLQDLENQFYQHHYDQMYKIPKSDMLLWEARDQWKSFWKHLEGNYYTFQKDFDWNAKPTADNPLPANTEKHPILHFKDYIGLCQAAKVFDKYHQQFPDASFPHIVVVRLQEDMGGLSQSIPGVTTPRYDLIMRWKREGKCKREFVMDYINHKDTLAVITSQFQIIDHPKVHSLPLGLRFSYTVDSAYTQLHQLIPHGTLAQRPKLLMVNSRTVNRFARSVVQARVLAKFKHLGVQNTYGNPQKVDGYFQEMAETTFIFSPAGAGWDCYRNWEALYMGTIPVIEHRNRRDGWYRTFEGLPVAWIDSYENLTPQWLEQKYQEILQQPVESYKWDKLTRHYWIDMMVDILKQANIDVKRKEPTKNGGAEQKEDKPKRKVKKKKAKRVER